MTAADAAPPTRRAPSEQAASLAEHEADALMAAARRRSEAVVAEARRRAGEAGERAEREGREAADAGLAAAWRRLREAEADRAAFEERLRAASRRLAETVLVQSLERDPSLFARRVRKALAPFARARRVALYLHPADAEVLDGRLGELGFDAPIELHADPTCPRWGLRAETDVGALRSHRNAELDLLVESLKPWPFR